MVLLGVCLHGSTPSVLIFSASTTFSVTVWGSQMMEPKYFGAFNVGPDGI